MNKTDANISKAPAQISKTAAKSKSEQIWNKQNSSYTVS